MKAKALFYLNRCVKAAYEQTTVDHTKLAEAGLSYSQRKRITDVAEGHKDEAEALQWAWEQIAFYPKETK